MPLLRLQTNLDLDPEHQSALSAALSQKASEWIDKPEDYVQVILETGVTMRFGGTEDPTAFVEIRSLGFYGLNQAEISHALCDVLDAECSISPNRVFINFFDLARENWGWDGKTFG
jgi:phenylpyruvate tautomerase